MRNKKNVKQLDFCKEYREDKYMDFTQEQKNKIEGEIVDVIISKMENNNLTEEDASLIADFVLSKIDAIKSNDETMLFLKELSTKWPFFENIAIIEGGEIKDKKEDVVAQEVLKLTKNGKINDAISLAKTMTQT